MLHITPDEFNNLLSEDQAPCVSIYHSTQRSQPENHQGPIRFKNQLREVKNSLNGTYKPDQVKPIFDKLEELVHNMSFWNSRPPGMAIFASRETFQIVDLQQAVNDNVIVADTFHLKPILKIMQSAQRYHLLGLNRHEAKLYIGDKDALHPVPIVHMPSTVTEALGAELTEPQLMWRLTGAGGTGGGKHVTHQGRTSATDDQDLDIERFFRVIDKGVLEYYTNPSGLPLILAALPEYHGIYQTLSRNPKLQKKGIPHNPDSLSLDQLRQEAWKVMEPTFNAHLSDMLEAYNLAKSKDQGTDNLSQIAKAAINGRVATLMIESDRIVGGKIDRTTGRIKAEDVSKPDVDDILDDLAAIVARTRGEVLVIPQEQIPSKTGAAAIFRY